MNMIGLFRHAYYNTGAAGNIPATAARQGDVAGTVATELPLDLKVLQHLRGYTEELVRYSNLIKQTNPRGMSAVEFLLKRPSSRDGFLETLCRLVRDGETVLSAVEAAELAGMAPKGFLDEMASRPDFPQPLFRREHRALWRAADVEAYLRTHGATQSGRL